MLIKWFGHASFLIVSRDQVKIITDPYTVGRGINYLPINETADIVTKSHDHGDHNNIRAIKGNPSILSNAGPQAVKNFEIKAVPAYHDEAEGSKRGSDLIFCMKVDGMNLCHLGDLGHQLSPQQLKEIGQVDILFIPVGGYYTIDAREATAVVQSIQPKMVLPMHYKTPKSDYPIAGVEEFLKGKSNVRRVNGSEIEIQKNHLPKTTEILVLEPAN
jgi:L-ascorbate metabolism protein UlaG (beta-lactamase superfamily)